MSHGPSEHAPSLSAGNATGLVLSEEFCAHAAQGLPEKPVRIEAIRRGLEQAALLDRVTMLPIPGSSELDERAAVIRAIERNHTPGYVRAFERLCAGERPKPNAPENLGTDETPLCAATFDVTWRATGAVLRAVDEVASGRLHNAFCTVRPPGHHAETARATGFCYVNHVAVAARHLLENRDGFVQHDGTHRTFERVLIVDVDLHHGNGAQKSFFNDDRVMFCSLHGHPDYLRYPGTGHEKERGAHGNVLNIPFIPGSSADDYLRAFEEKFLNAADAFRPQFVLVSAGFDTHRADPLNFDRNYGESYMSLLPADFRRIAGLLADLARRHCDGRLVSILEGGYNLNVLGACVAEHLGALIEAPRR